MTRSIVLLFALLAACGKDAVAPPPPPPPPPVIVKLIMAPDTGFWRGHALGLASLVRGAVNSDGDTVAAPAVTWTLPTGFARQGDSVIATKETRGMLRASFASIADSTGAVAVNDLSVRTWATQKTCYNSVVAHRAVEEPPIGIDSLIYRSTNGSVAYQQTDWKDLRATLTVQHSNIVFWKDGIVDTAIGTDNFPVVQDTARASIYLPGVENLKMEADSPRVYRAAWVQGSTWCADFIGGGSDFILREP